MLTRTKIRKARKSDTPFIMDLLAANNLLIGGLDWSDIGNTWWVATHKDDIVGCMQVLLGKPLGVLNFLAVDPKFVGSGVGVQLFRIAQVILSVEECDGFLAATDSPTIINRADDLRITKAFEEVTIFVKRVPRYAKDTQKDNYKH